MACRSLTIDPAHPAFAGHFPGQPILPGVVLLDEVIRAIEGCAEASDPDFVLRHRLAAVKFHRPAGPSAVLRIELDFKPTGGVAFAVTEGGQPVASGSFAPMAQVDQSV